MSLSPPKEIIQVLPARLGKYLGKTLAEMVNCFSVSELFYRDTTLRHMSTDDMLEFVTQNFIQFAEFPSESSSLALIWSNSSSSNTLEHSFVLLSQDFVVHKPDPKRESKIEVIARSKCIKPYENIPGFRMTWHIPKPNTFSRTTT